MARSWRKSSGWSGKQNLGGETDFTVTYGVELDSREDGTQAAAAAVGIQRGNTYAYGNDVDTNAVAKAIIPRHMEGKIWEVTIAYGPIKPEKSDGSPTGLKPDGTPTENPLEEMPIVTVSSMYTTKAVEKAKYIGTYNSDGVEINPRGNHTLYPGRIRGQWGPVTNSAGAILDPPIEMDHPRWVVRVSRNVATYNASLYAGYRAAINLVNGDIRTHAFELVSPRYAVKIMAINGRQQLRNGQMYWREEFELHIDHGLNGEGWHVETLDRGYDALVEVDAPDGQGDASKYTTADLPALGNPHARALRDANGEPLSEPVNFDGKGQPLIKNAQSKEVYIRWGVSPELDFTPLNLHNMNV